MNTATREAYGNTLVELIDKNKDVVVLDADLAHATKTLKFSQKCPERFFNMGIAGESKNIRGLLLDDIQKAMGSFD